MNWDGKGEIKSNRASIWKRYSGTELASIRCGPGELLHHQLEELIRSPKRPEFKPGMVYELRIELREKP